MPGKDKNNPFETLMGEQILVNIREGEKNFARLLNDQFDHLKYQQQQANESAMQPLLIRLDTIIGRLEDILEKL